MKKRLIILLALLVVAVSVAAVTANAEPDVCPMCGEPATWTAVTATGQSVNDGHFYLAKDGIVLSSNTVASGKSVCLDLQGYRVIFNKNITVQSGGTFRVANGQILTRGVKDVATNGGAFAVNSGGSLYLEDVEFLWDTTYGRDVPQGGFIYANGNVDMKNTTLAGGKATTLGGNLFLGRTGELTVDGGSITGGTANSGSCTYIRGKVTLKGGASIDNFYIVPGTGGSDLPAADIINLDSSFTGSACLSYLNAPAAGDDLGNAVTGADISGLTLRDSDLLLKNADGDLIAYLPDPVVIMQDGVQVSTHSTLTDALKTLTSGQTLMLQRDLDETVTISADTTLDLNGCDLTAVNVTAGTLYVMDSQTDDYACSDGNYGKIGAVSDGVQGLVIDEHNRYLRCQEADGFSFHRLHMQVTRMSLRAANAGLYFESEFQGDSLAKAQISSYGVAMSLDPADLSGETLKVHTYTSLPLASFNGDTAATSSILTNIMKTDQGSVTNRRNAATKVYGKPYVKLTDGTLLWGTIQSRSLQEQVTLIEAELVKDPSFLNDTQLLALTDMYYKFRSPMSRWEIPAVKQAWQELEEETLKILTIGNSHANDSNWQLQNVFAQQDPEQKVTVGVLYYSGCSVAQHVNFAKNNLAEYQYYKNETGSWVGHDTPLDTMRDALEDEQWDIVLLQEMNIALGQPSTFQNDNLQYLIDYVYAHTDVAPKLGFNMVWANPVTDIYWNESTRPTTLPNNWVERYESIYGTDQMHMYECMTDNVQTYILTNASIDPDYVMPSGTAVQYANNVLGMTDLDLYRDYTHISEFSRLMVSYLWYCKLTGETFDSIDDIQVDVIPAHLRHSRFTAEGDMAITDEMKQAILEAINYAMNTPYEVPEVMNTADPAADNELNVLMIGNSFCYYYPDELVEMAKASGKQLRICNLYKSGCSLKEHYTWLQSGYDEEYTFFVRGTDGTYIKETYVSLEDCLSRYNWDIISLQEGSSGIKKVSTGAEMLEQNGQYLEGLLQYIRTVYPKAQIAWHQTWAYQVGTASNGTVTADEAAQHTYNAKMREYALLVCEKYDMDRINTGEAWRVVRDGGYDNLCARLGKKWADDAPENSGDNYHDGDIGGGQYLNACVWYEYLFGLDVRENTFVPTYDSAGLDGLNKNGTGTYTLLIDYKLLQEAAHAAFTYGTHEIPAQ